MSSIYEPPPLNARRAALRGALSLRCVCVQFSLQVRWQRKEPHVASETLIVFPPFRLDVLNEQLWRDNELVPVRPKPFAVLAYLATHAGRLGHRAQN